MAVQRRASRVVSSRTPAKVQAFVARIPQGAPPRRVKRPVVWTIGYAGKTFDQVMELLFSAGVRRLVDVRALPLSRRREFSKTALAERLAAGGIEYVHVRSAGNPFRHLSDDIGRCLALYREHLVRSPDVLAEVARVTSEKSSALFCVEAEATGCHRSVIADQLRAGLPIRAPLGPAQVAEIVLSSHHLLQHVLVGHKRQGVMHHGQGTDLGHQPAIGGLLLLPILREEHVGRTPRPAEHSALRSFQFGS